MDTYRPNFLVKLPGTMSLSFRRVPIIEKKIQCKDDAILGAFSTLMIQVGCPCLHNKDDAIFKLK